MAPGDFSIERSDQDGRRHLTLVGELDIETASTLRSALSEAQADEAAVVVDTTGLTFIDSTGLATLIATRQRMGERFTLVAGPTTHRLLRISGTLAMFGLEG
jgi:anti-anti-sigma factor